MSNFSIEDVILALGRVIYILISNHRTKSKVFRNGSVCVTVYNIDLWVYIKRTHSMPLSLDDAMYLIINYYQIHLERDYTTFTIECLPPCLRSFFAYYSRFRTTQALLPQNSYYLERNYDWSERLMKEPQNPPPPTFDLVCHDPQLAPIVNTDCQSLTSDSPCHCVHCFIHDAYFLLSVHRCIYVFSPTSTSDLSPFVLSSSEFQSLRDGTLHLRLFNVIFEDGKWSFSPSRYRFYFNSIDVFSLNVPRPSFPRSRTSPSRTPTTSAPSPVAAPTS